MENNLTHYIEYYHQKKPKKTPHILLWTVYKLFFYEMNITSTLLVTYQKLWDFRLWDRF